MKSSVNRYNSVFNGTHEECDTNENDRSMFYFVKLFFEATLPDVTKKCPLKVYIGVRNMTYQNKLAKRQELFELV